MYNALQNECSEELNRAGTEKFKNVTKQNHDLVSDNSKQTFESLVECQAISPLNYNPLLSNVLHFKDEIWYWKTFVLENLTHVIDSFVNSTASFFKYQFVVGMPGSGKIFVTTHSLFYALCNGLNVMVTSLSSERAMQFSGMHIHDLFALPVSDRLIDDDIVEKALQKIDFDFVKQTILKRLDVIYFEEIGLAWERKWAAGLLLRTIEFI